MCLIEMECVESGPKRQKRAVISLLAVALRLTLLSGAEIQGKEKAEDKREEKRGMRDRVKTLPNESYR